MRPRRAAFALFAGVMCGLACVGCDSGGRKSFGMLALLQPQRSPQEYMLVAVSDAGADERREAVAEVAESDHGNADWAIDGFTAIALLDEDPQARSVALRALGRSGDPRAVDPCLKVLRYEDYTTGVVREPSGLVRTDAAIALAELADGGVEGADAPAARDTLINRLHADTNRNVRVAAARALHNYADLTVLEALIESLADVEFAVVFECERSLMLLTGETHDCSQLAWEQWLSDHRGAAFANRGNVPEEWRPNYTNRFEKASYKSKQVFSWLFPGRKKD